jgi:amino acid transporter
VPIKAKKFGAFAGVFTPSLLTILGVIMYMRLGWVVGQAGLINALVIILIAHIISVTTGLGISSIATDKKIKAGGIYYILSRSLGLPMGGAIGIALFLGTALSISLYLIGFAENFLGIDAIREFTGLEQNLHGYRIVGSGAIVVLVVLAFISTSLAIKTQFYILAAIGLSLVSIGVGFFLNTEFIPDTAILEGVGEDINLELVFAVFFPAVTGFTAGVAMSGDLKDPKKAIPIGTLSSILVGLVVYVLLAIGLAYFVNRDLLLTDNNFLLKIAWFSPFVIAGIWGATLSSALGGILGGPRILQAISTDKITPKLFAKGYGLNNEPRNALIAIFILAEAGILIGELNLIARIVSMFYLASYGFINFAFFLESWASTDFRPSFKVNRYFGLIGFIASFGVMFQLDMLAMFAALFIMTALYFYLRRRKFKSEYGDVWQSVYSSVVRTALHKMDKIEVDTRNWQPNIVLYSGGTKKRPHLIEFGKSIVGKHGVMANFDLIENAEARFLFPKHKQSLSNEDKETGIFTRRQTVRDIYDGIETISSIYGVSGFEPNTVLMGWARQTRNPERFVSMLNQLYDLDLNILLLDYDKRVGFGKYKQIDIWWEDTSRQGNLSLTLSKLILLSDYWQNASIRLMIVNSKNEQSENILNKAEQLLDQMRINAMVKVINNQIEHKPIYDLMLIESKFSDLVIFGIPKIKKGQEESFVEQTNKLLHNIGTVLLVRASSEFKKLSLGINQQQTLVSRKSEITFSNVEVPAVILPAKSEAAQAVNKAYLDFSELIKQFDQNYIFPLYQFNRNKIKSLESYLNDIFDKLESTNFKSISEEEKRKKLASFRTNLLIRSAKIVEALQATVIEEQKSILESGINFLLQKSNNLPEITPGVVQITLDNKDLEIHPKDDYKTRSFKRRKQFFNSKQALSNGINYEIKFSKLIRQHLPVKLYQAFYNILENSGRQNIQYMIEFQLFLNSINESFEALEILPAEKIIIDEIQKSRSKIFSDLNNFTKKERDNRDSICNALLIELSETFNIISKTLSEVPANHFIKSRNNKLLKSLSSRISRISEQWTNNQNLLLNGAIVEIKLLLIKYRLRKTLNDSLGEIEKSTTESLLKKLENLNSHLSQFTKELIDDEALTYAAPENSLDFTDKFELQRAFNRTTDKTFRNIKSLIGKLPENTEYFSAETLNELTNIVYDDLKEINISTFQLVDFYVQNNLLEPYLSLTNHLADDLYKSINKIKDAVRLISIGSSKSDLSEIEDGQLFEHKDLIQFSIEQKNIVKSETKKISSILIDVKHKIEDLVRQTTDELSINRLLKNPEKYKRYVKRHDLQNQQSFLGKSINTIKDSFSKQRANLWYKQSDAWLFARKIGQAGSEKQSIPAAIIDVKEIVSPDPGLMENLPFYYQQLFLYKYNYQKEFWFDREKELAVATKTYKRYENGHHGALLVTGDKNAGKTFFATHFAEEQVKQQHIFIVNSPRQGSVIPEDFMTALQDAVQINGSLHSIFSRIPAKSIIVIDDLELWWEKSIDGQKVIELIQEMIHQFASKCFFLLCCHTDSYNVIRQMNDLDPYFINTIKLLPFNAESLQRAIMFRHNSSGFELRLNQNSNTKPSTNQLAKLFAKHFSFSDGNIGEALLSWISNIVDLENKVITIKSPQSPQLYALEKLSADLQVILSMFVLHKRMNREKLQRVSLDMPDEIEAKLNFLLRSGLIKESAGQIFELDKYMYNHIKKSLFNRNA